LNRTNKIIQDYLIDKKDQGVYWLSLDSVLINDTIMYRADIGHETSGAWKDTIQGALNSLVATLKRQGEIK
jgi:hypothetical protein